MDSKDSKEESSLPSTNSVKKIERLHENKIVAHKPRISYCTTTKSSSSSSAKSNRNKIEVSTLDLRTQDSTTKQQPDQKGEKFMEKMEK